MAMPLAAAPYRASGLVLWHKCDVQRCPLFGRYQEKNGRRAGIAFL